MSGALGRVEVPMPGHLPLAAWIPSGLPSLVQALTVLGGQLQGCGGGLRHGEECVRDVRQKAIEIQKLAPAGLLLWAPQQHGYHAGEELLAPSLWWLPPHFRLGRQSRQQPLWLRSIAFQTRYHQSSVTTNAGNWCLMVNHNNNWQTA